MYSLRLTPTFAKELSQLAEEGVVWMQKLLVGRQELFHVGDARLVDSRQLDGEPPVERVGGLAVDGALARVTPVRKLD